jgi:hypothetical protein
VEIEAAGDGEHPVGLTETRLEECQVIVERVREASIGRQPLGAVATTAEPGPVTGVVAHGPEALSTLNAASIEGRVDIDEVDGRVREGAQDVETLTMNHSVRHGGTLPRVVRPGRPETTPGRRSDDQVHVVVHVKVLVQVNVEVNVSGTMLPRRRRVGNAL